MLLGSAGIKAVCSTLMKDEIVAQMFFGPYIIYSFGENVPILVATCKVVSSETLFKKF